MEYCCERMKYFLNQESNSNNFTSDNVLYYSPQFNEYGIVVHDGGESYIEIAFCPWCGTKLPDSKRDEWFSELEKMGIESPLEVEIPERFNTSAWWKQKKDRGTSDG